MAFSTITATLANSAGTVTLTLTTADFASAVSQVQNIVRGLGMWDNTNENFYPMSQIEKLTIS